MFKKKAVWSFQKDEALIDLVKSKPELYDCKSTRYNDIAAKKNSWHKVGIYLNIPGPDCKIRWESLRCQYRKNINKRRMKNPPHILNAKWRLEEQMAFLQEHMRERTRDENSILGDEDDMEEVVKHEFEMIDVEENILEKDDTSRCEDKESIRSEEKTNDNSQNAFIKYLMDKEINCERSKSPHPIDIFFSLMAATVKTFNIADQHLIKTKVFALVNDMEGSYIEENSNGFGLHLPCQGVTVSPTASPVLSQNSSSSCNNFVQN